MTELSKYDIFRLKAEAISNVGSAIGYYVHDVDGDIKSYEDRKAERIDEIVRNGGDLEYGDYEIERCDRELARLKYQRELWEEFEKILNKKMGI